ILVMHGPPHRTARDILATAERDPDPRAGQHRAAELGLGLVKLLGDLPLAHRLDGSGLPTGLPEYPSVFKLSDARPAIRTTPAAATATALSAIVPLALWCGGRLRPLLRLLLLLNLFPLFGCGFSLATTASATSPSARPARALFLAAGRPGVRVGHWQIQRLPG